MFSVHAEPIMCCVAGVPVAP